MFGESDRLFNEMVDGAGGLKPNEVTYPMLIHSLHTQKKDALQSLIGCGKRESVTIYPYSSLVNGCCKHNDLDRPLGFLSRDWIDIECLQLHILHSLLVFIERGIRSAQCRATPHGDGLEGYSMKITYTVTVLINCFCKDKKLDEASSLVV